MRLPTLKDYIPPNPDGSCSEFAFSLEEIERVLRERLEHHKKEAKEMDSEIHNKLLDLFDIQSDEEFKEKSEALKDLTYARSVLSGQVLELCELLGEYKPKHELPKECEFGRLRE